MHVDASLRTVLETTLRRWDGARIPSFGAWTSVPADPTWDFAAAVGFELACDVRSDATDLLDRPIRQCVQYEESDFAFVSRLLEDAGFAYYFEHVGRRCVLVLADSVAAYGDAGDVGPGSAWRRGRRLLPTKASLRATTYRHPDLSLSFEETCMDAAPTPFGGSDYGTDAYSRAFDDERAGGELARIAAQRIQSARNWGEAVIWDRRDLTAGQVCRLRTSPDAEPIRCLLTSVSFEANASVEPIFAARVRFVPLGEGYFEIPYRPPQASPRPRISGSQTAIVTSTDAPLEEPVERCVRVRFEWDRDDARFRVNYSEVSSAWLRVSQTLAGASHGAVWSPREGDEVVVEFLDGNPDFPIVTGAVFNAKAPGCYGRSDHVPWTGFVSGPLDGAATYDNVHLVALDHGDSPGIEVRAGGQYVLSVATDASTQIGGRTSTNVDGDSRVWVGGEIVLEGGGELGVKSSGKLAITSSSALELRGSILRVNASMVVIEAGLVKVSGVLKCDTLVANAVVAASYTPGAGNIF